MAERTRKIGISAVNAAVVTRLKTNALTIAYAAKIFNNVPVGTKMPYLHVTGFMSRPSAMFASRDHEPEDVSFEVHVWSDYQGDKEAAELMDLVSQALTGTALAITGYTNLYKCQMEYSNILIDDAEPTNLVRHGICRFLLRICP